MMSIDALTRNFEDLTERGCQDGVKLWALVPGQFRTERCLPEAQPVFRSHLQFKISGKHKKEDGFGSLTEFLQVLPES